MSETPQQRIDRLAEFYDTHQGVTGDGDWLTEPAPTDPMVVFSLRLPKAAADQLRAAAAARSMKTTELAREWIVQRLSESQAHDPAVDAVAGQLEQLAARLRAS